MSVDSVSLTPNVGETLDADQDEIIDADEIKGLAEIAPHLVLNACFDETSQTGEPWRARLRLQ